LDLSFQSSKVNSFVRSCQPNFFGQFKAFIFKTVPTFVHLVLIIAKPSIDYAIAKTDFPGNGFRRPLAAVFDLRGTYRYLRR
jgi:hypothetical protein